MQNSVDVQLCQLQPVAAGGVTLKTALQLKKRQLDGSAVWCCYEGDVLIGQLPSDASERIERISPPCSSDGSVNAAVAARSIQRHKEDNTVTGILVRLTPVPSDLSSAMSL